MIPLAPGRFSTTTGTFNARASGSATWRAMRSGGPPGACETTSRIERDGQSCATAPGASALRARNATIALARIPAGDAARRIDVEVFPRETERRGRVAPDPRMHEHVRDRVELERHR